MTVSYDAIRRAFNNRMMGFPGLDPSRINWPNSENSEGSFPTPKAGEWIAFNIQYGTGVFCGYGEQPQFRRPGQIVIQCFARRATGETGLVDLADRLCNHFQAWSSGDIQCWEASLNTVGGSKDFYQINVSVRFSAG